MDFAASDCNSGIAWNFNSHSALEIVQHLCHDLAQLSQKFNVQSMVGFVSHHMASRHPSIAILCQQCKVALQTWHKLAEKSCKHDSGTYLTASFHTTFS